MLSADSSGHPQQLRPSITHLVTDTRGRGKEEPQAMNPIVVKSFSPSVANFVTDEQAKYGSAGFAGASVSPPNAFTSQAILRANRSKNAARNIINRAQESKT